MLVTMYRNFTHVIKAMRRKVYVTAVCLFEVISLLIVRTLKSLLRQCYVYDLSQTANSEQLYLIYWRKYL